MTETDYRRKLNELNRLLNDPEAPLQPQLVWTLLAEIAHHDAGRVAAPDAHGHAG